MKPLLPSCELLGNSQIEIHYQRPLSFKNMIHISCADDANTFLRKHLDLKQLDLIEYFWVILLTNANRVLGIFEVARGTTLGVQTNPKYILQLALLTSSSAIILVHNHPSGNLNISKTDIKETEKFKQLSKLMDITLLDHIIITSESYTSFIEEGHL